MLDSLEFEEPKTKKMIEVLKNIKADKKAIIVTDGKNENVVRSASNIPGVQTSNTGSLNCYEMLKANSLIITKEAVEKLEEVYS